MVENSRTENVAKNIAWGYIANVVTMLLSFVSRTIFIYTIGSYYLGINGLFTNVLGILSFTELGIGNVMNYSLYKPLATNDTEKLKSLMKVYKKAYRIVMLVVAVIGIAIIPFLPYMIKGAKNVQHIYIYYCIFLFNTVSSYMVSYKCGLINAAQKGYILNNINMVVNIITVVVQSIALLIFQNYLVYLVVQSGFQLIQRGITSVYIDRVFPFLREKEAEKLPKEEVEVLKENVEAMVYHKIGDVCVNQTDNIIVSSFINVTVTGMLSNYTLITSSINKIVLVVFNSFVAGLGNFVVTESKKRKKEIFKVYNFMAFWIYSVISVELIVLIQSLVKLWAGEKNMIDTLTAGLIVLEVYLSGLRLAAANFKTACGIFNADKYIGIVQAVVNLTISIVLAKLIGLPGVFIGTVAQGMVDTIWRPRLIYKLIFDESPKEYYFVWIKYLCLMLLMAFVSNTWACRILSNCSILNIILVGCLVLITTNLFLWLLLRNTEEFKYLFSKVKALACKIIKRT